MRFALAVVAALAVFPLTLAARETPATPAQSLAQDPDFVAGNEAFGKEDWAGAVKAYQAALNKGVALKIIHFRLGYSLHMLKRYEEALTHHLQAVQLTNRALRIDALYNCCCANALLGRKEEALKFFQYAIDAGFKDTAQVEKDTDLDSLREDERFKKMAAGIGKAPRLDQQLDFLIATWEQRNKAGEVKRTLTLARPLSGSVAITTTAMSTPGGSVEGGGGGGSAGAWTGLLSPRAADRSWVWMSVDGLGTVRTLTGKELQTGIRFEGRDTSIGGDGPQLRFTLTPVEGGVMEKVEVSEDGTAWRVHHEERYEKKPGS